MANAYSVVGQDNPGAVLTALYTVPSATDFVGVMWVANRAASAKKYRVAISPLGAGIANDHYIAYDVSLAANDSVRIDGFALTATDVVRVYGEDSNLSFSLMGVEVGDAAPGGTYDDEFDGASLDTAWTTITVTGSQTITQANGVLSVAFDTQTSGDFNGIVKSATIATGDYLSTAMRSMVRANFDVVGIGFADGTTSSSNAIIYSTYYASDRLSVWTGTLTNMTETDADSIARNTFVSPVYLKLSYDSANTFTSSVSPDGVSWIATDSSRSFTLTPTHFGLFWSSGGGSTTNIASYDFIRLGS